MTIAGTLFTEPDNGESRHYEKSSVPQKPTGDISVFAGSDCKPTARQRAVGPSGRAGRFGGRACHCDTTTMHATRRRTTAERIKNPSYVHSRPLTDSSSGREKTTRRQGGFSSCVQSSNAISRMAKVENKRTSESHPLKHIRYVHLHWTSGHISEIPAPYSENLCPVKNPVSGRCGHVSGEVTL